MLPVFAGNMFGIDDDEAIDFSDEEYDAAMVDETDDVDLGIINVDYNDLANNSTKMTALIKDVRSTIVGNLLKTNFGSYSK